jgi:hypothetical protein
MEQRESLIYFGFDAGTGFRRFIRSTARQRARIECALNCVYGARGTGPPGAAVGKTQVVVGAVPELRIAARHNLARRVLATA